MNNRTAFIDFVRGLLTINPLERWSPQQAKLHPFITQQKFTGPFVPPMNLKSSSLNRSLAPGTQQQQQAEALSKQRAQQAQAQASSASQGPYGAVSPGQYPGSAPPQAPLYGNNTIYSPGTNMPPPYSSQTGQYGQLGMSQQQQQQPQPVPAGQYGNMQQPNMYAQGAMRNSRQRSSTMEQQQSGIPAAIQRVASHLDPSQPIRLQPSPAYYPPPGETQSGMDSGARGANSRRTSRTQQGTRGNRDFIRNLEERTLEEGFMGNQNPWH